MLRWSRCTLFYGPALLMLAATLAPRDAHAHFRLVAPASWAAQDSLGSPQKAGPCGESDTAGVALQAVASNVVTTFRPGQTIAITIMETVFHAGHYRVALATNNRSELPAEPAVTPGTDACGSTVIQDPPVFPVLADGVLKHTAPFAAGAAQTAYVTLPSNVTCTNCTLQIIEFMTPHGLNIPGGCFYHHCANIAIQGPAIDGGSSVSTDAAAETSSGDASSARDAAGDIGSIGVGGSAGAAADSGQAGSAAAGGAGTGGAGSGGAGGAASGSAGATAGSGGAGASAAGAGGSGGVLADGGASLPDAGAAPPVADDASGCSCSLERAAKAPSWGAAFLWAIALAGLRRRAGSRRV